MLKKNKNNKGFTLVELLVVIAIIGILAVVAVPALFKNIEKSKVASLESDISAIKSASMSYVADNNKIPTPTDTKANILTALKGELDGISDPFKAEYELEKVSAAVTGTDIDNGDYVLTITLPNGSTFSDASKTKLGSDLGTSAKVEAGKIQVKLFNIGTVTVTP